MSFKVLTLNEKEEWLTLIKKLPLNQQDIYYTPEYYELFENFKWPLGRKNIRHFGLFCFFRPPKLKTGGAFEIGSIDPNQAYGASRAQKRIDLLHGVAGPSGD